jgi:MscS family membrane protein
MNEESALREYLRDGVWILETLIGIGLLIGANFLLKYFIKKVRHRSMNDQPYWKQRFEKIVYVPAKCILWVIGIFYVLNGIALRFDLTSGFASLHSLRNALIVICIGWILLRWTKEVKKHIQLVDMGIVQILSRVTHFAIIVLTLLLVLEIFDVNVMPLIAFGGVGAAAIGFAAKDVLANFFGGLMLHVTRPFTMGDFIVLPDRNIEGHVETVGWYFTAIRDKEKRPVYLPNVFFSTLLVINASRMSHRHILESIGLRYEDIDRASVIIDAIKQFLAEHPLIDHNLPIIVSLDAFQDYAVSIKLDCYCLTTRTEEFYSLKQEVLLAIYAIITRHGAEIPYPTSIYFQK